MVAKMFGYIFLPACLSSMLLMYIHATPTPHTLVEVNFELAHEHKAMDKNGNGFVDILEYDNVMHLWDYNDDGCVSVAEFLRSHRSDSLNLQWSLFNHYDHNQDGCLEVEDLTTEFHEMDISPKDDKVTAQELEAYYDKVLMKIGFLRIQN